MMSTGEMRERAIRRALGLGLAGEVVRVRLGWYRLPSTTRPGTVHTVRVVDGRYRCDCEAGRSGRPCAHAAAVFILFIRKVQQGGATVVAPAREAAPLPAAPGSSNVVGISTRRAA
jgi:hypothetical protein